MARTEELRDNATLDDDLVVVLESRDKAALGSNICVSE
jgi:hypothetical protein